MIGLKRGFLKKYTEKYIKDDGKSLSGNGYVKLSNGLIIQWGVASTGQSYNSSKVVLPIAFTSTFLSLTVTAYGNSTNYDKYTKQQQFTKNGLSAFRVAGQSLGAHVSWIAIGR